jgi:Arc/MetJ-type ribon-helix-helix transcriptional regulator
MSDPLARVMRMVSMKHEGLLALFRNRPTLAAELLQKALGVELPPWSEARVESAEFTQVVPTEYRADLVILLLDGKPILAIVVEVQLSADKDKRESWPLYLTSLRSRVGCPVLLLVVAPDAAVARWCARPIELGHPGFVLRPLVLGPEAIPVIVDEQAAREDPELAVLSAMAHGRQEVGAAIARAVLGAAQGLDDERCSFYVDLTMASLSAAVRQSLEELMKSGKYEYQTEFVRKLMAQGLEQGRQEGEMDALLEVLDARGLNVDAEARQRILSCEDLAQLKVWLRKAVTVSSVQELFEPAAS